MNLSLGDRMKTYESVTKNYLTRRTPVIVRIDGKAFHTYTRGLKKPYDEALLNVWTEVGKFICKEVSGAKLGYFQSDEFSLLITDYDSADTQPWFDNQVQKQVSVIASMVTAVWNQEMRKYYPERFDPEKFSHNKLAMFDARAFNVPKEDVNNYFLWRQRDCTKNSVSMVAQANFPHKRLQGLNGSQMQELLFQEKGINWNDCPTWQKRGVCIVKGQVVRNGAIRSAWEADMDIPIFSQDPDYVNKYVFLDNQVKSKDDSEVTA